MVKIAFILLCHKDPEAIIKQANRLTAAGDFIAIHFDARARESDYRILQSELGDNPNVVFARKRIKCGWGEWSLVAATLQAVESAYDAFPRASHFYMLSGDCMPIKSAEYIHQFLEKNNADFIESFDFFESGWIKTGMDEDRLIYRHFVNERKNKTLFYQLLNLQKWLGLKRSIPDDIQVMIGSQWWCLRRHTIQLILEFTRARPDVMSFFKRTWIPDETFFQTLVRHLVARDEIRSRTLTFLMFTDYGMPVTFYDDHYNLLLSQDFLFARKISPEARLLKRRLGQLYAEENADFHISNEGEGLYKFLAGQGRIGRRVTPRFWENESTLGRNRELMIVICKKWHVAKRLIERVRVLTGIPTIEFLFNEESSALPDLGGIQKSLSKRHRHRRVLMRMLFDYFETDRMIICMDPSEMDLLKDFADDRSLTRMLEVQCDFTDDYLAGHAKRIGLSGENTSEESLERLLPTIRNTIAFESDRIRDAEFPLLDRMRQSDDLEKKAKALSRFLSVPDETAREIASVHYLFSD